MAIGLVGRKCGMTRVFTEAGESIPVTVIEVLPNRVTQIKSTDKDGYRAIQVTYGARRPQLLSNGGVATDTRRNDRVELFIKNVWVPKTPAIPENTP